MKPSLIDQIERKKNELSHAKPHSRRRHVLYVQIREMITRQLRKEIRDGRITT